mgnify:CR=1 FL=1
MKNYAQVYVKNSLEAAQTYCEAFGAEITVSMQNPEALPMNTVSSLWMESVFWPCRKRKTLATLLRPPDEVGDHDV